MAKRHIFSLMLTLVLIGAAHVSYAISGIENFSFFEPYKPLPTITLYNEQGKQLSLDDYKGDVVILSFWATWCSTCALEMPMLEELQKQFSDRKLKIIPVSLDFKSKETVKSFYAQHHITHLPLVFDMNNQAFQAFALTGLPTSYIIDADGQSVGVIKGEVNWRSEEVLAYLETLIDPPMGFKETASPEH